jgi:hypothetical protein
MFFRKMELLDRLNRDLAHTRNKRDTLASSVTTLTAQIAELEARISVETERRKRERVAGEIVHIQKRVRERYLAFTPAIAGIRNATEAAETIAPEARQLNELLDVIPIEVAKAIDGLLSELDLRIEAVLAGNTAPELSQSLAKSAETPQISDRVHRLPKKPPKEESAKDQYSTATA